MASLADCYLRMEELGHAEAVAAEVVEVARQRSTRLPECRALIRRAAALVSQHGAPRFDQADDMLRRAERLIDVTGAAIYRPLLAEARARVPAAR